MKASILAVMFATAALPWTATKAQESPLPELYYAIQGREPIMCFYGEANLSDGKAVITLPSDFETKCQLEGRALQLTCRGGWSPLWATPIADGKLTVSTAAGGSKTQAFWWEVKAVLSNVAKK